MTMHRVDATLKALTIVFAVAGAIMWILPPSVPNVRVPPSAQSATLVANRPIAPSTDSSSAAAIIASNIFSPSRAAPGKRYTPPGAAGESEDASAGPSPDVPVMPQMPPPRVFGTMMGPGGASALMQLDSAGASGRLYREGQRIGTYRILKISSSSVIVRGPAGRVELKIHPREDSTQ